MQIKFIDKINKLINDQIEVYDYNGVYDKLEEVFKQKKKYRRSILKIIIKNNNIVFEDEPGGDKRKNDFVILFVELKRYLAKTSRKLSDCIIYLYVTDSYNFEYQELPFFIMARPNNKKGILLPDNTFRCHNI